MSLEDLQKKLYRSESDFRDRPLGPESFEPSPEERIPFQTEEWKKESEKPKFVLSVKNKKTLKILGISFAVLILGLAGFFVWRFFFYFNSSKISFDIYAPERLVSGEEVTYVVRYKNKTNSDLKNARLYFFFPEHSIIAESQKKVFLEGEQAGLEEIGNIKAGAEGQSEFRASIIGLKNEKKFAQAKLVYQPENVSSNFENLTQFESEIILVPIVLNFELPEKTVSGQQLDFLLKYLNTSETAFYNVTLQIDFPAGFELSSTAPSVSKENTWFLSEISPKEEGAIAITGKLNGAKDEVKTFQAKVGFEENEAFRPVSEGMASTIISAAPLSVELLLDERKDETVFAGEELNYKIKFKNTVDLPISSVYIIANLSSKILDYSSLESEKGFFNDLDNSIAWNESGVADLKMLQPGQEGELSFSIKVKEKFPVNNFSDKNFTIKVTAKANSSNIPISLRGTQLGGVDEIETKMNSKLVLSAKGFYQDSVFSNSGPLPPRVGLETTYSIYWQVINIGNDLENAIIEAYLPPNVRWLGNFQPGGADISYNESTGKIIWRIGNLSANTGIMTPVKQIVFQVGLLPASNEVGNTVEIIKESKITGRDIFTQSDLEFIDSSIDSDLPDDESVGYELGRVAD
ncbi:MAG: hypothetical protein PHQ47_01120 [Candidatus Portnoybacteria bacterium]|nr:hypothetical protein [Candidatus Portnoybacteria bacterium]